MWARRFIAGVELRLADASVGRTDAGGLAFAFRSDRVKGLFFVNPIGQLFERIGDDLGEGGVIPRCTEQIEDGRAHRQRAAEDVDQFAGVLADNFRS